MLPTLAQRWPCPEPPATSRQGATFQSQPLGWLMLMIWHNCSNWATDAHTARCWAYLAGTPVGLIVMVLGAPLVRASDSCKTVATDARDVAQLQQLGDRCS